MTWLFASYWHFWLVVMIGGPLSLVAIVGLISLFRRS